MTKSNNKNSKALFVHARPCVCERERELTSGFRLDTRMVHLSFVPLIPGGKPPPKAAAMAAAFPI